MHESVKNYIYGTEEEKTAFLLKVGLYEKVYTPDGVDPDLSEYPFVDESTSEKKRYKKVALPVTDEEYKEIQKAYQRKKQLGENTSAGETQNNNTLATAFGVIGIIIFSVGFVLGLLFSNPNDIVNNRDAVAITTMLNTWAGYFQAGMIFIGLGEIIKLLHNINKKL